MCDCSPRCNMARPDRVIPPGSDPLGTSIPLASNGFANPVMGNVRGEPVTTLPTLRVAQTIANTPPAVYTSPAGAALANSESGAPVTDLLKDNWPWLLVAALVVAAAVWK